MQNIVSLVLVLVTGLSGVGYFASEAIASCRHRSCAVAVVAVPPTAVQLIQVPLYSGYVAEDAAGEAELRREIQALRRELEALRKLVKGGVADVVNENNAPAFLADRCAKCHTGEKSKGGFQLVTPTGAVDPTTWTDAQLAKLTFKVYLGEMPPAPAEPLTDPQVEELVRWLNKLMGLRKAQP